MKSNQKKAAALSYDKVQDSSPRVVAKGKGLTAEKIIEKAKEHQIPTLEDSTLVELLEDIEINEAIPNELYEAVAEVYSFIYRLDQMNE